MKSSSRELTITVVVVVVVVVDIVAVVVAFDVVVVDGRAGRNLKPSHVTC
jgi:hypothetical protein